MKSFLIGLAIIICAAVLIIYASEYIIAMIHKIDIVLNNFPPHI